MFDNEVKKVISYWRANIGNLNNEATEHYCEWLKSMNSVPLLLDTIDKLADDLLEGRLKRAPTLRHFKKRYYQEHGVAKDARKFPECNHCGSSGLVAIVMVYDPAQERCRPVPAKLKDFRCSTADVESVPCICERGRAMNEGTEHFKYRDTQLDAIFRDFAYMPEPMRPYNAPITAEKKMNNSHTCAQKWAMYYERQFQEFGPYEGDFPQPLRHYDASIV